MKMNSRLTHLAHLATVSTGLATSGRAAGARAGGWELRMVSVGDIQDDRLVLDGARPIALEQTERTERHLLRPGDLLITARSTIVKAAIVPLDAQRTVADATLLVVRPHDFTLPPFLWWYLTSTTGRAQVKARMTGSTVLLLTTAQLGDLEIPVPDLATQDRIAELVQASERAYRAAVEAAELRRSLFRDAIVAELHDASHSRPVQPSTIDLGQHPWLGSTIEQDDDDEEDLRLTPEQLEILERRSRQGWRT